MFNSFGDLSSIARILINDNEILKLLDLEDKTIVEKAKTIIQSSQWSDLVDSKKRLCVYFLTSRSTRSETLFEEIIEIDCHVPAGDTRTAGKVIDRVINVLDNRVIDGRYIKFRGQFGDLATTDGFYCRGAKFGYYNPV